MATHRCQGRHLARLLRAVEALAELHHDGHYTILRFTTHYKALWGTPDLDSGAGRDEIRRHAGQPALEHALVALLSSAGVAVEGDAS